MYSRSLLCVGAASGNLIMQFDMPNGINALVTQHRVHWLGNVGRTNDRLLKQLLFGELLPTRPVHGLR